MSAGAHDDREHGVGQWRGARGRTPSRRPTQSGAVGDSRSARGGCASLRNARTKGSVIGDAHATHTQRGNHPGPQAPRAGKQTQPALWDDFKTEVRLPKPRACSRDLEGDLGGSGHLCSQLAPAFPVLPPKGSNPHYAFSWKGLRSHQSEENRGRFGTKLVQENNLFP